jgi:peptidoglycan/LPS O-acetylase OafA/YrhL
MSERVKYYKSIDGLRALSIVLVLLFHAGFSWVPGGFIGVDVFFVISGFLITKNVLSDIENKNWSFITFYKKRMARLLPALFVIIFITLIAAFFIIAPGDLAALGKSGVYSVLSLANLYFFSSSGYFDSSSETKSLLHTWSLSVEEQFYLIWPALLFLLYLLGSRKKVIIGIVLISLTSLILTLVTFNYSQNLVFFYMPFRVYQFGFGALLSLFAHRLSPEKPVLKFFLGIFSILLLLLLSTTINGTSHPWLNQVLPAIAAVFFIYSSESRLIHKIFSSSIPEWIGKRSYSIYLVHWPLMVLWKMGTDYEFNWLEKIASIIVSLLLGVFLYEGVEKRYRIRKTFSLHKQNSIITGTISFLILLLFISSHFWGNSGYPDRISKEMEKYALDIGQKWKKRTKAVRTGMCNRQIESINKITEKVYEFNPDVCMNPPEGRRAWFIIGDSYASDAYLFFKEAYPEIYFGQLTIPGCQLRPPEKIANKECASLYGKGLSELKKRRKFNGVILASNWHIMPEINIKDLIVLFHSMNLEVVVVGQRLKFRDTIPNILSTSMNKQGAIRRANSLKVPDVITTNENLKSKFSNEVKYLDVLSIQCPKECIIFNANEQILYLDHSHLSLEGVNFIASKLTEEFPGLLH